MGKKVAPGNGSSYRKSHAIALKPQLQPTCSTRISISPFTFFPWKYLALWRRGRNLLSKDADCFTLSSLFPKVLPPEVHVQTHSPPSCSLPPRQVIFSFFIYIYCVREGKEYRMGGLDTQVPVLPSCFTSPCLHFILCKREIVIRARYISKHYFKDKKK